MKGVNLEQKIWWEYLSPDLKDLLQESFLLLKQASEGGHVYPDYAFMVFPAAKAYEGFLKKLFLDQGFITSADYYGKRFRIGKALNPSLEEKYRHESVYDKIVTYCGGRELADQLWETWKGSRNTVFHWFPDLKSNVSLAEAIQKVLAVIQAIDLASQHCKTLVNKETQKSIE
jgi:hypothetical protein